MPSAGQDSLQPEQILVLKPSSMGDVIHALPAVAMLKVRWPDSHLSWLVNPEWAPLLEDNQHIDRIIEFPRSQFRGIAGLWRFPGWLNNNRSNLQADLVVDYQGLLRTALIGRAANPGIFAGLDDAREGARWFYNRVVETTPNQHSVERYLSLSSNLCNQSLPTQPEFQLPDGNPPAGFDLQEFLIVHPFSRGQGKSLQPHQLDLLLTALSEKLPTVIVGRCASDTGLSQHQGVTNLLNATSLQESIWLMRHARAVISVDSGPMHIAAAVNPNTLGIHTWSDPAKVGPYSTTAQVWKEGQILPSWNFSDNRSPHARQLDGTAIDQIAQAALNLAGKNS